MHPEENTPGPSGLASAAHRRRIILSDSEDEAASQHSCDDGSSSDSSTSSSGGGRPQCCICLCKLSRHEVASPELCDHLFCILCLQSWAEGKTEATCPIDRHPFTVIKVRSIESNEVLRELPVNTSKKTSADQNNLEDILIYTVEDEFNTYCEVCRECDREAAMLLCDSCDCGYHMDCLQPALEVVPVEEWFCPTCRLIVDTIPTQASSGQTSRSRSQSRGGRSASTSQSQQRGRLSTGQEVRVLPRTREVERVRKRVRKIRENKACRGARKTVKRKSKKKRDEREQLDTSETRDKFTDSIIPALSMVRDDGDDIDAFYTCVVFFCLSSDSFNLFF
ncbi:Zinc finger PHD-finger [Trinorchestia longiramus]|nr:Zinc finger PHD-finger [Trinorchestia longiramus]